jgi:hypothetical protein
VGANTRRATYRQKPGTCDILLNYLVGKREYIWRDFDTEQHVAGDRCRAGLSPPRSARVAALRRLQRRLSNSVATDATPFQSSGR